MGKKSLFLTYFLWFFFGWSGIHHFYLRRDKQAFVWWSTCGGFVYLGWIRDFWRIPEYVEDANDEPDYIDTLKQKMKLRKEPPFNSTRFAGQVLVGFFYGLLVRFAFPGEADEIPIHIAGVLVCLGITAGVCLVGNIGRQQGPFFKPYLASLICYMLLSYLTDEPSYFYCSVASACTFTYFRQYKGRYEKKSFCTRITYLSCGAVVVFALWGSFFYFNASITLADGETIRLRESINHFFKSPAWLDFKKTMWEIYEEGQRRGWKQIWEQFIKAFDPTGEANAYKTLGIQPSASVEEIRRVYKKLVVKWHPDRYHGNDKEDAQKRFIDIQQAYELLGKRKKSSRTVKTNEREEF